MVGSLSFYLVIVFFFYGLAFFCMGLLIALEVGRSSQLGEAKALWFLAAFGLLHGAHEWLEMSVEIAIWFDLGVPPGLPWARVLLLAISFSALVAYGLYMLYDQHRQAVKFYVSLGVGLLVVYLLLTTIAWLDNSQPPGHWLAHSDVYARYFLAVPGGVLAAIALSQRARQAEAMMQRSLRLSLLLTATSFAIYGFTQVFVTPLDFFPANTINTAVFREFVGFPVQLVRAVVATSSTIGLIRVIQIVNRERQRQLMAAQQARLEALQQLQNEMDKREAQRKELLRHIVIAQEEERARIARELHDETAQILTALSLHLATIGNALSETTRYAELLDRLRALINQMSQGIYRLVRDLRPAQLDDLGIVAALEYLVGEERKRSGLQVSLEISIPKLRLDSLVETVFFRVAQEALTNVVRHAQIDRAEMRLLECSEWIVLQVEDHGVGFDPGLSLPPTRGFGIAGMRERAESVGGQLLIRAALGEGTLVEIKVPSSMSSSMTDKEVPNDDNSADAGR